MFLLGGAGCIHSEEKGVHEELKDLLLPGSLSVCITTQIGQQLGTCPKTGHIIGTGERENEVQIDGYRDLF